MVRWILPLGLLLAAAAPAPAAGPATGTVLDRVWETLDAHYPLFAVKGVDWAEQGRRAAVGLGPGSPPQEVLAAVGRMLAPLRDDHVMLDGGPGRQIGAGPLGGWIRSEGLAGAFARLGTRPVPPARLRRPRVSESGLYLAGRLEGGLAYLHLAALPAGPTAARELDGLLEELRPRRGLILDLRRNGGGSDETAAAVAGRFADQPRPWLLTRPKEGSRPGDLGPVRHRWIEPAGAAAGPGPVVVLQDRRTLSAAENLLLALRDLPTVCTLGDTTSGCFADMRWQDLGGGWRLSLPTGLFTDHQGRCWEGIGVPPDVRAPAGSDPLDLAVARLRDGIPPPPSSPPGPVCAELVSLLLQPRPPEEIPSALDTFRRRRDSPGAWIDAAALLRLARATEERGRPETAALLWDLAEESFPAWRWLRWQRARFDLRRNRPAAARDRAEQVLADNPRRHRTETLLAARAELLLAWLDGGVEDLDGTYRRWGRDHPEAVDENRLNELGYDLLAAGRTVDAVAVLARNVKLHPVWANGWDSLGEACAAAGDSARARRYYRRSLRLDPDNGNARRRLEMLGEGGGG